MLSIEEQLQLMSLLRSLLNAPIKTSTDNTDSITTRLAAYANTSNTEQTLNLNIIEVHINIHNHHHTPIVITAVESHQYKSEEMALLYTIIPSNNHKKFDTYLTNSQDHKQFTADIKVHTVKDYPQIYDTISIKTNVSSNKTPSFDISYHSEAGHSQTHTTIDPAQEINSDID